MVSWKRGVGCLAVVFAGCTGPGPRVCTERACADAATITTKLSAAGAPTGEHTFVVEVDGVVGRCSVQFASATSIAYGECAAPGTSLWIGPVMRGQETTMVIEGSSVVMHSSAPVPGEFEWQITVHGRPNGEGCEPVCKAATAQWQGP